MKTFDHIRTYQLIQRIIWLAILACYAKAIREIMEKIETDGLRQDVLYPNELDKVQDRGKYRVDIGQLQGIKQILAGYDLPEAKQRYVMLPEVTAIFPSITFASWASIFTGKQPNETGIPGNEFFARDVYSNGKSPVITWMAEYGYQPGYVKFDIEDPSYVLNHSIPLELLPIMKLQDKLDASSSGQLLQTDLLWKAIKDLVKTRYQLSPESDRCDLSKYECATTAMFNQYAKGADWWGTPSLSWKNLYDLKNLSLTKMMDMAASNETVNFINNYFSFANPADKRKRFPALFSVYFSALDHFAHMKGMTDYSAFFKDTTDPQIKDIITVLKAQGEFDNKIFIVVADHGHTAMPTDFPKMPDEEGNLHEADSACKLKVKDVDKDEVKYPELANNNLHIWELANFLMQFPSPDPGVMLRVLAPQQIADASKGATADIEKANIKAVFNGPMAHMYVKGNDWTGEPDQQILDRLIVRLNNVFKNGTNTAGSLRKIIDDHFPKLGSSVDAILVRRGLAGAYQAVDDFGEDTQGNLVVNSIPLDQYLSQKPEYVEALARITDMNNKDRSGDIVLIMRDDSSGTALERYTTGVACKSWHGSLNKSDSYVPFILAYPGGSKNELENYTNTVCADNNCRGNWKLSQIIKKIIETQYSGR